MSLSKVTQWRKANPEKAKKIRKRYENKNRKVLNEKKQVYRKNNSQVVKNSWYLRNYGITSEEYEQKLENQGRCCAICKIHASECQRALAVDHDHKTGKNRDLLCVACNITVGFVEKKSPEFLETVRAYLDRHGESK